MTLIRWPPLVAAALCLTASGAPRATSDGAAERAAAQVTLQGDALPLDQVLHEITAQTGSRVVDRRQDRSAQPKVALHLHGASFWQAVDAVARAAGLRVCAYEEDDAIALRDGPAPVMPMAYAGPGRVALTRLTAVRGLETGDHFLSIRLEAAWEPRWRALFLEGPTGKVEVRDDRGTVLQPIGLAKGREAVAGRRAAEVELRTEAPPRTAQRLALLRGELALLGSRETVSFSFDQLPGGAGRTEEREGVRAQLEELQADPDRWKAVIRLTYPPGAPELESFEAWAVSGRACLEARQGGREVRPRGYQSNGRDGRSARLTYYFDAGGLGRPEDWRLRYETLGPLVRVSVPFAFKDVPLP